MIERRITETLPIAILRPIESIEQEPATASRHLKNGLAAGSFIPIEISVSRKHRADDVGRSPRREKCTRLPVEVVAPTCLGVFRASKRPEPAHQEVEVRF